MKDFTQWQMLFDKQQLYDFTLDSSGVIWLKLKSLMRKNILKDFCTQNDIHLQTNGLKDNFQELYALYQAELLSTQDIDNFLLYYNQKESYEMEQIFETIKLELYKLQEFSWGGDSANSLDKQIVSYVKDTYLYDDMVYKIENDIAIHTRKYTLNSWYNNWTSILTEHLFKKHKYVLSAIGKIKSVDFFIKNIPIDLKITYLPKEYFKMVRKNHGLLSEMTFLKKVATEYQINFNKNDSDDLIKYQILEQAKDKNNSDLTRSIQQFTKENHDLIQKIINNKFDLIKWLYESQGEMRFGAENRLFIVLINPDNMVDSWKLKRNFTLLEQKISSYLDFFQEKDFLKNTIGFNFKGKSYKCFSDIIFISHQH